MDRRAQTRYSGEQQCGTLDKLVDRLQMRALQDLFAETQHEDGLDEFV